MTGIVKYLLEQHRFPRVTLDQVGQYLYHGTSIPNAATIIAENTLAGIEDEEGPEYEGVSLTTNFKRAAGYAKDKTEHLANDFAGGLYPSNTTGLQNFVAPDKGAVFVVDAQKVLQDYDVRAVIWQESGAVEERVIGSISPISKYLVSIVADPKAIELWKKRFEDNLGISKEEAMYPWIPQYIQEIVKQLEMLSKSSLISPNPPPENGT